MRAHLALDLKVFQSRRLRAHGVKAAGGRVHRNADEEILDAIVDPKRAPLDFGCEILHREIEALSTDVSRLHLIVEVRDAALLAAEAQRAYAKAWDDAEWEPESVCDAVYEAMIGSNGNPPPVDMGFEIVTKTWLDDAAFETSPAPGA